MMENLSKGHTYYTNKWQSFGIQKKQTKQNVNNYCINKVFAPPFSGMRSPSPSCVTSCGSSTRRRTSRGRRWFAATRPTARDCRRRWGRSGGLLRGLTSLKQDYCPLEEWRRWFFSFFFSFSPRRRIIAQFFTERGMWTQNEKRGSIAWKKGWYVQKEGWYEDDKRRENKLRDSKRND